MNRSAYLAFALDVLAIAAVTVLGALRVVPPEAVIAFFGCVWAAGRSGGGPPRFPPAASSAPTPPGPNVIIKDGLRRTLLAQTLMTLARLLRDLLQGRHFRGPPGLFARA